jgi:hypothetical protein
MNMGDSCIVEVLIETSAGMTTLTDDARTFAMKRERDDSEEEEEGN